MPATSVIKFRCGKDCLVEDVWGSPQGEQRSDIEQVATGALFPDEDGRLKA
jgi:hypothetical protein